MNSSVVNVEYTEGSLTCPRYDEPVHFTARVITLLIAMITMIISVVLGNILVIKVVYFKLKMQINGSIFIISLAVADLLIGLVILPFSAMLEIWRIWNFGETLCTVWLSLDIWLCTASIFNLCIISYDRFLTVSYPFSYAKKMPTSRAKLIVAGVWFLTFLASIPPLAGWRDHRVPLDMETMLPPNFLPTLGPNGESLEHITDISEFLDMIANYTLKSLLKYYSAEFVEYIGQVRAIRQSNIIRIPRIYLSKSKFKCPRSCELTNHLGYVLFSSGISFLFPLTTMLFFYSRIYGKARKSYKSVEQGYVEAEGSGDGPTITLRVHRGGQATCRTGIPKQDGSDRPSRSSKEVQRVKSLRTRRRTTRTRETSFIEEPLPGTSSGTTGPLSETDQTVAQPVSPTEGEEAGIPTKSICKKGWLVRMKLVFSKGILNKKPGEEDPSCGIELAEGTGSTPQPSSTEPGSSNRTDSNVQTDRSKLKQMPTKKRRYPYKRMIRIFNNRRMKERLRQLKRRSKAARTIGFIVGVFAFFWAPFYVLYVIRGFCIECVDDELFALFFWFGYINSALNPFIYVLLSDEYGSELKHILDKIFCRKRPQDIIEMKKRKKNKNKKNKKKKNKNTLRFFNRFKKIYTSKRSRPPESRIVIPLTTLPDRGDTAAAPNISITITEAAITNAEGIVTAPKTTRTFLVTARRSSLVTTTGRKTSPITTRSASLGTIHIRGATTAPPLISITIPGTAINSEEGIVTAPKTTKTFLVTARRSSLVTTTGRKTSPITTRSASLGTMHMPEATTAPSHISITAPETAITTAEGIVTASKTTKTLLVTARRSSLVTTTVPETSPITTRSASLGTMHIPEATTTPPHISITLPETAITSEEGIVTAPKTTKTLLVTARRSSLVTTTVPETTATDTQATTALPKATRRASVLTKILRIFTRRSTRHTTTTPETSTIEMTTTETATTETSTIEMTTTETATTETTTVPQATTAVPEATSTTVLAMPEATTAGMQVCTIPVTTRREMRTTRSSSEDIPMDVVIEIPPDE